MIDLSGKVAFVTGAGPNIGQGIARGLAACGAAVAVNDLDAAYVQGLVDDIIRAGGRAMAVVGDVTDEASVERMLDQAESAFGTVDVLVNNAFWLSAGAGLTTISTADWNHTLSVVLNGTFFCSRAVARRLIAAQRRGVIINLGSTSGHRGRPNAVAYCASKGGILNLTRAMAIDLAPHGIRVCSASPTRTGKGLLTGGVSHASADGIPMGRLGEPEDIAKAIAFLASDDAQFITGEDLRVDGGSLATWGSGPPVRA